MRAKVKEADNRLGIMSGGVMGTLMMGANKVPAHAIAAQ